MGPAVIGPPRDFPYQTFLICIYVGKGPQARLLVIEPKIASGAPVCAITTCTVGKLYLCLTDGGVRVPTDPVYFRNSANLNLAMTIFAIFAVAANNLH